MCLPPRPTPPPPGSPGPPPPVDPPPPSPLQCWVSRRPCGRATQPPWCLSCGRYPHQDGPPSLHLPHTPPSQHPPRPGLRPPLLQPGMAELALTCACCMSARRCSSRAVEQVCVSLLPPPSLPPSPSHPFPPPSLPPPPTLPPPLLPPSPSLPPSPPPSPSLPPFLPLPPALHMTLFICFPNAPPPPAPQAAG